MKQLTVLMILILFAVSSGCATVDVTKTARGFQAPTNPNDVDIIFTRPERPFAELASVAVRGFNPGDTAKLHNSLRQKCARFGASAVLLTDQGMDANGHLWAIGVAIAYQDAGNAPASPRPN